ncbi:MAG: hypothetical protein IPM25_19785 [Chloracidobacterium sp.]|nr:hypothetical protein [Chloracidobacterium sp.]
MIVKIGSHSLEEKWENSSFHRWMGRPPKRLLADVRLYVETVFPLNPPSFEDKNCRYLPDNAAFFREKCNILDSLERDTIGKCGIICRVPWLIMPDDYALIALNSPEARDYYSRLEAASKSGKLRYLYNLQELTKYRDQTAVLNAFARAAELHCYPMILNSTSFDVMITNAGTYNTTVIFATRSMGFKDVEEGILIKQKSLFLEYQNHFDDLYKKSESYWKSKINEGPDVLSEQVKGYLIP